MNVGVTGATGKIGRSLVKELMDRGYTVRALARKIRQGFWGDTTPAVRELEGGGAEIAYGEFGDPESIKAFVQGLDVLVHNGYHHCHDQEEQVEWVEMNVLGSMRLIDEFRLAGGKQFIFISSGAVYGHGIIMEEERFGKTDKPIDENTATAPRSIYAAYKRAVENLVVTVKYDFPQLKASTAIRPGCAPGVGQLLGFRCYDDKGLFSEEIKALLAGKEVVFNLPEQFTCVDGRDIANGCDLLIQKGVEQGQEIMDWYLMGNSLMTATEFKRILKDVFGDVPAKIEITTDVRKGSNRAFLDLGYRPRGSEISLRDHLGELARKLGVGG